MTDNDVSSRLLDADLVEQLDAIIDWLRGLDDSLLEAPTLLPGWDMRDLVAHLALSLRVLSGTEAVDATTAADLTLAAYLGSYGADSDGIRDAAVARAESSDPVAAAEEEGRIAVANLHRLRAEGATRVRVRRGVVDLDTLVMTRLVELVVHGDDLARSTSLPGPVDPTARTIVAKALLRIVARRTGYDLEIGDERTWIRLASGRVSWDERGNALRPGHLAEGLPDLRGALPVIG